jgi:hypothetical protein
MKQVDSYLKNKRGRKVSVEVKTIEECCRIIVGVIQLIEVHINLKMVSILELSK